jgi:hypothetical protein
MSCRYRHRWRSYSCALLCLCLAASTFAVAQSNDFEFRHQGSFPHQPFSLDWGTDIPPELLEQLTARAEFNWTMTRTFKCSEEVRRGKSGIKVFDYLLQEPLVDGPVFDHEIEALRFKQSAKHEAGFSDSIPPPFAWTLLFSDAYRANFTYRYLGGSADGHGATHTIAFRGIRRFDTGTDVRQWEGIAIVDARTYEILRIEAAPRNFAPIVEHQRRKYQMAFQIAGIRLRKKPRVQVLSIDFRDAPIGVDRSRSRAGQPQATEDLVMKLPKTVVWQEYRINSGGNFFRKWTEERRYSDYRTFEVEASDPHLGP